MVAPALASETAFLGRGLAATHESALLRGVAEVHEIEASVLAVGRSQQIRDDFAQGRVIPAEHMLEEDLAVKNHPRQNVGARIEFLGSRGARSRAGSSLALENGRASDRRGISNQRADRVARA